MMNRLHKDLQKLARTCRSWHKSPGLSCGLPTYWRFAGSQAHAPSPLKLVSNQVSSLVFREFSTTHYLQSFTRVPRANGKGAKLPKKTIGHRLEQSAARRTTQRLRNAQSPIATRRRRQAHAVAARGHSDVLHAPVQKQAAAAEPDQGLHPDIYQPVQAAADGAGGQKPS